MTRRALLITSVGSVRRKLGWCLPLTASLGSSAKPQVCLTIAKQDDATAPEIPRSHVCRSVSSNNTQGMNPGLVDACTPGRLFSDTILGRADHAALERYKALCRPAASEVLALAGRLTEAATLRSTWKRQLRNLDPGVATSIPTFSNRLARNLSGISRQSATPF